MGLLARLKEEWRKVTTSESAQYGVELTEAERAQMPEDGTAYIESRRCNWEVPTAKMSKRLAANVDEKGAAQSAVSKAKAKPRVKGQEQRTRE